MISIIIPVKNDEQLLRELSDEYNRQSFKDFEIITVVDSMTTDGSVDVCMSFADGVYVIEGTKVGRDMHTCALMRNYGASQSCGDILVHTDCDVCFRDDGQLERVVSYFINNGLNIASTRIYHQEGTSIHLIREIYRMIHPITTGFILIRRHVFNALGGFHPGAWHDVMLDLTARRNGINPVIVPEMLIHKRKLH